MSAKELLNPKQRLFAEAYNDSRNATECYRYVYPGTTYDTAKANGSRMLADANVRDYVDELEREGRALTAIFNGRNKRRLARIADVSMDLSTRIIMILNKKVPALNDVRAIDKVSLNSLKIVTQTKHLLEQSLKEMNELSTQLTGASDIAAEILDRIESGNWDTGGIVSELEDFTMEDSLSDSLTDRG